MTSAAASAVAAAGAGPPPNVAPVSSLGFAKPDNCPARSEHSIQGNDDVVVGNSSYGENTHAVICTNCTVQSLQNVASKFKH